MRTLAAAMMVLALGAGTAQAQAPSQECGLKQLSSLPMEVLPQRLLVPITLGTVEKQMVFHMEEAANYIATDSAKALELHQTSMPTNVHFRRNGLEIERIAHVPEAHLGSVTVTNMEFLIVPQGRYTDKVIGDIGTSQLQTMDLELDMAGGKFNLFSPDHCPGNVVYWTKAGSAQLALKAANEIGYVRTDMTLDGSPVTVALSTVGQSRIGMNAMRRIFHIDETSPELVVVDQDLMGHKLYRYPFKTLTADGLTIANPNILVFEEKPRPECSDKPHFAFPEHDPLHSTERAVLMRCFGGDDLVLGLSVLRKLHIYVSGKEKQLYLTSAEAK